MAILTQLRAGQVLVTGAGVSGTGTARLLIALGCSVVLVDDNQEALAAACRDTGARPATTEDARILIDSQVVSAVVTSPGWRPDTPLLAYAHQVGIDVLGDVELAYRLDRAEVFGPARTWLVVTGTNGKTTTTAMLADMMARHAGDSGRRAQAVGNIGLAVANALTAEPRVDVLVAELSSFQLHWSSELTPDVGVLLNLAEDHIDWHGSFPDYAAAKAKVLGGRHAIIGADDPLVREQATATGRTDVISFTLGEPAPGQLGVQAGRLVDRTGGEAVDLGSAEGIEPAGPAGQLDALAAAAAARTQGVSAAQIAQVLAEFRVDGHRGAVVHHGTGQWVDNSKATNPHAADAALAGLRDVLWIAGGQLKGAEVDDLVRAHAHRLSGVALLGVDRGVLAAALAEHAPDVAVFCSDSVDPEQAMDEVVVWAAQRVAPEQTVLLAPAAASLDMFTGMAHRGDTFAAAARRHDQPQRPQRK
ncbi:MAG TPA: UDP-N-acetylmuramoyl-L-alanine--D-glutamate ligase [Corynebacterium sp.]|nr:UDP-N-acetylmuramoyl-L-alanine--D-glutamate ligase [Corynebacterium sp.]